MAQPQPFISDAEGLSRTKPAHMMRQDSPNAVTDLQLLSPVPTVYTETRKPYKITAVNEAWTRLCGYDASEAIGKSPRSLLSCSSTNQHHAASFSDELIKHGHASVFLYAYGRPLQPSRPKHSVHDFEGFCL